MKLGIFDHMQKNDRPELSYQDLYARHLDMVQFLDEAGFDYYFVPLWHPVRVAEEVALLALEHEKV
jgi:alkanesulfonate monooxygenase SsuD/methylene tetrahydromethanopterin reductase-like flavin-dependent oxidoreductase (luciferase family)